MQGKSGQARLGGMRGPPASIICCSIRRERFGRVSDIKTELAHHWAILWAIFTPPWPTPTLGGHLDPLISNQVGAGALNGIKILRIAGTSLLPAAVTGGPRGTRSDEL